MKRSLNTVVYPALMMAWLILAVGVYVLASQYDFVHIFIVPLVLPGQDLFAHLTPGVYLLDLLTALTGAAIFAACCVALGLLFVGGRSRVDVSPLAVGTSAFLVGEIIFSVIFLSLIVRYKLTPVVVGAAFVLALLAGGRRLFTFVRALPRPAARGEFAKADRLILILAVAVLALGALYSSAILGYDSVVDYFSQAKMLAVTQTAVHTLPNDPYLVSSFHTGILYTAVIQLFGDQAARLISWLNGLAVVLLGLAIGEETGVAARARLWFLALMATTTAFVDLLADGKVELISTVPLLAAIYWMLRAVKKPDRPTFALIGLLLGFAVIARPYNIFLTPIFVAMFCGIELITLTRRGSIDLRAYWPGILWVLPPLLLLGGFHLLQNWLWLGNPLAPVVAGVQLNPATWQWQFDPKLLNVYRLLYPFVVTMANSPQSLGNITPFVIGAIPFLFVTRVRKALDASRELLWLALAAMITLVIWLVSYFTVVEVRYVFFVWVIFFLVIAQVMDIAITRLNVRGALLMKPLVIFSLLFMGARIVIISLGAYAPVDRTGQAHCYVLDLCTFLDPLNKSAAPGERVFVVNAYRYYLRPDLFACASRADEYGKLESLAKQQSPEFWTEVYRAGFRYVTYEANFATFHSYFGALPATHLTPGWLHVSVLSSTGEGIYGNQEVYQLVATRPPFQPSTYCQQDAAGIWEIHLVDPAVHE